MFNIFIRCTDRFFKEMSSCDMTCLHICAAALGIFLGASASDKSRKAVKVFAFIAYIAALSRVIAGVVKKFQAQGGCCECCGSSEIEYDDSDIGEEDISF